MATKREFDPNAKYESAIYPRRQSRDCVEGATKVKNSGELYLPMPASWVDIPSAPIVNGNSFKRELSSYNSNYLPHTHQNPAYRAYLQRARFPDITANTERGMVGLVTKKDPEVKLPSKLKYLEEEVNLSGEGLKEFYDYCLSEVLTTGNINIVVDLDADTNQFYLTSYTAEATIDWDYVKISGGVQLTNVVFVEDADEKIVKEFGYADDEEASFQIVTYTDGEADEKDFVIPTFQGKKFDQIPVFPAGSRDNLPDPQPIALQGISDIAIAIYQETADLRQAHFMTCNPTLFLFGAKESEKPSVIGSQVVVCIQNPQAKADYPKTDTSALDHIREYIDDLFKEAVSYGVSIISSGAKESGEALSIRRADQGVSLVKASKKVAMAIENALKFIARMHGLSDKKVKFDPNLDFAEMELNSQDITALVSGWMQGAWDRDMVLDNMREAGYIKNRTNAQIKNSVESEAPEIDETVEGGQGDDTVDGGSE